MYARAGFHFLCDPRRSRAAAMSPPPEKGLERRHTAAVARTYTTSAESYPTPDPRPALYIFYPGDWWSRRRRRRCHTAVADAPQPPHARARASSVMRFVANVFRARTTLGAVHQSAGPAGFPRYSLRTRTNYIPYVDYLSIIIYYIYRCLIIIIIIRVLTTAKSHHSASEQRGSKSHLYGIWICLTRDVRRLEVCPWSLQLSCKSPRTDTRCTCGSPDQCLGRGWWSYKVCIWVPKRPHTPYI